MCYQDLVPKSFLLRILLPFYVPIDLRTTIKLDIEYSPTPAFPLFSKCNIGVYLWRLGQFFCLYIRPVVPSLVNKSQLKGIPALLKLPLLFGLRLTISEYTVPTYSIRGFGTV